MYLFEKGLLTNYVAIFLIVNSLTDISRALVIYQLKTKETPLYSFINSIAVLNASFFLACFVLSFFIHK